MGLGDRPFIRVYERSYEYRVAETKKRSLGEPYDKSAWKHDDFDIEIYDLEITIEDNHASLVERNNGKLTIDYDTGSLLRQAAGAGAVKEPNNS